MSHISHRFSYCWGVVQQAVSSQLSSAPWLQVSLHIIEMLKNVLSSVKLGQLNLVRIIRHSWDGQPPLECPFFPVQIRDGANLAHGSYGGWCCRMESHLFCQNTRYRLRQVGGDLNDGTLGARPLTNVCSVLLFPCQASVDFDMSMLSSLCQVSGAQSMGEAPLASSVLIGVSASSRHLRRQVALLQVQRQLRLFYIDFSLAVLFLPFLRKYVHKPYWWPILHKQKLNSPPRMQEPGDLRLSESGKHLQVACAQRKDLPGTKL